MASMAGRCATANAPSNPSLQPTSYLGTGRAMVLRRAKECKKE